jgi:hypothetical protein
VKHEFEDFVKNKIVISHDEIPIIAAFIKMHGINRDPGFALFHPKQA